MTLARAGQPLAASVAYTVATLTDDTATADADYTPASATLAFGENDDHHDRSRWRRTRT